ncbi:MAG: SDR family oxidoreductase [Nitrososphaeraceae archaeon]
MSSVHQRIPKPHYIPYSTSKAGLEMMTKTMALELASKNIRANLVAPGAIATDMNRNLKDKKELQKVIQLPHYSKLKVTFQQTIVILSIIL